LHGRRSTRCRLAYGEEGTYGIKRMGRRRIRPRPSSARLRRDGFRTSRYGSSPVPGLSAACPCPHHSPGRTRSGPRSGWCPGPGP